MSRFHLTLKSSYPNKTESEILELANDCDSLQLYAESYDKNLPGFWEERFWTIDKEEEILKERDWAMTMLIAILKNEPSFQVQGRITSIIWKT